MEIRTRPSSSEKGDDGISDLLRCVETFDTEQLTRSLVRDWKRMSPLDFLNSRIVPLSQAVGGGWAAAGLEIRHERFLSERVGDLLRSVRLPLEEKAHGPLIVCASLPGEEHSLGLQMVALLLTEARCRVLFLGTEVPPTQVASLTRDLNARAVAIRGRSQHGSQRCPRRISPRSPRCR